MLTPRQIEFYHANGFLHIPGMFSQEHVKAISDDMDWLMSEWADRSPGWSGPWRKVYMDEQTERASKLVAMHDLHFYAESWMRTVTDPKLCDAMSDLLGPDVALHHSTMHVKPQETGHPFPMHQDWAFYQHNDGRFIDVLVHLDDTCHENGEIRFLPGSHKQGALEHVTIDPETGEECTPHLPTDQYSLEDTVAVPANAGDVVCFCIHTIHGSHINQTEEDRRMVRIGYRHPDNVQTAGQSCGRPNLMVRGRRQRREGLELFSTEGPSVPTSADEAGSHTVGR